MANGPLVYVDKNRVIKNVYQGSQIISQIYNGSDIVFSTYPIGGAIFESSVPGTYNFNIQVKGIYEVTIVGAGGGTGVDYHNFSKWHGEYGTGGSGAAFVGRIYLTKGVKTIVVGGGNYGPNGSGTGVGGDGGDSSISGVATCTGGTAGIGDYSIGPDQAGQGGTVSVIGTFKSISLQQNGNNGAHAEGTYLWGTWTGGASVYGGYGVGGTATTGIGNRYNSPGGNGYVKITYIGHATS